MLKLVGFDGDDTLWHSEGYYREANEAFARILGRYVDLTDQVVHDTTLATERRNLALFGYGAKGMTLSMVETAIVVTGRRIAADDIHQVIELGKRVLQHPVELLPGTRECVEAVAEYYEIVLITKGDLFHQEQKVAQSGLAGLFQRIEIVSEKNATSYQRVLAEFDLTPAQFAMVGNSLRSDIEPVVRLGGWGVHLPYQVTWAHELEHGLDEANDHVVTVSSPVDIPAALEEIAARAKA